VSDAQRYPAVDEDDVFVELVPVVRKIVGSRIRDPHVVDDLVQETLTRVMAAHSRVEAETLEPYAAVTARNLVASYARRNDRARSKTHLLVEVDRSEPPGEELLRREESSIVAAALTRLPAPERELLIAHEVEHQDTRTLATRRESTPGAVAAQLNRARAKLRVEYLLVSEQVEPTGDRCRPVLRALSAGDRRRQRELDAGAHLLECDCCARISAILFDRRAGGRPADEVRVPISRDADVVTARQRVRETAARVGFSATELTLIATAISEIARNIVRFAERGDIVVSTVSEGEDEGISIVARDVGPGIADLHEAMQDGYSTYDGLGLGLPGARRLMDQFDIVSEPGRGTTVTMTKWRRGNRSGTPQRREDDT
jgi:RNA polymerase sigma factor (sigma-70 family)